jgi:outer membrane autotransporter protein
MNETRKSHTSRGRANSAKRVSSPLFRYAARRFASIRSIAVALYIALAVLGASRPALALTFSEAINAQLAAGNDGFACARLVGGDRKFIPNQEQFEVVGFGEELSNICNQSNLDPTVPNSTSGAGGSPVMGIIYQRLRVLRESECDKEKCEKGGSGASADADLGGGVSVFVSANFQDMNRDTTAFEDGYDSDLWGVTVGTDFALSDALAIGLALNWNTWNGSFDSGGHFDKDSYGPVVYASFFPRPDVFAHLAVSYNRLDVSSRRQRTYVANPPENGDAPLQVSGEISGKPNDNEFSTSFLLGIDYPIHQFTVGTRFGLNYVYTDFDAYTEKGDTGLELSYADDSKTSLQSRLGLQASMAISTPFGVVVPQVSADWVHEYADNQRSISVQFAQDNRSNPSTFSFESDGPDRDFFEINAGISTVLPYGIQAFVNFWTLQGHKFLDSAAGSVGVRVDL